MKVRLKRWYWFVVQQVGIDPARMARFIVALPWYLENLRTFRRGYPGAMELMPCLHDKVQPSGSASGEYFMQDLIVAQRVFKARPANHLDVGSRIDGFVAHVASFRSLTVMDIRPQDRAIPNVRFVQADLMSDTAEMAGDFDSISCLHALEHFGLGRYGDAIDPQGFRRGLARMSSMLARGGSLYLSVPVGSERVEFNAHRVFYPQTIMDAAATGGLQIVELLVLAADGQTKLCDRSAEQLAAVGAQRYALGIFTFRKP